MYIHCLTTAAASKNIKVGEELLLEYGPKYWQNMEPHEVNSEGKAAAAPAASAATAPPLGAKKTNSAADTVAAIKAPFSASAAASLPRTSAPQVPEN